MTIREAKSRFVLDGQETEVHADAPYTEKEYEQLRLTLWNHFIECDKPFSDGKCSLCLVLDNWMRHLSEERKRAAKSKSEQSEWQREIRAKSRAFGLWNE
jgi:hypothetical protein